MELETGCIVGLASFPIIPWLKVPFSLVKPSSHLTLRLYAKRSAHPDILIGSHELPIPPASQGGSFVGSSLLFNQLNILRADIPCVLESDVEGAAWSTQPVMLYITINITLPNLYNSTIPTEDDDSQAEEATISRRIQLPAPEHQSRHQRVEIGNTIPQSREEIAPTSTKNPRFSLHWADKLMKRTVRIDRSNTWERVVGRIKWVMDTLSPIAEVRVIPF